MTLHTIDKPMLHRKLNRFLKDLKSGHPKLKKHPRYLGELALKYAETIAIAIVLGEPDETIVKLLKYQCDFGTAHFKLATKLVDEVILEIEGNYVTIAVQPIKTHLEFEVWQMMVWSAMILRSPHHFNPLIAAAPVLYGESFQNLRSPQQWEGQFLVHLIQKDRSLAKDTLKQLIQYVGNRKKATGLLPQLPILDLWNFFLTSYPHFAESDRLHGNKLLETALRLHQNYWGGNDRNDQPLGWISYPVIHALSWAYDRGYPVWESKYLPTTLVTLAKKSISTASEVPLDPELKAAILARDSDHVLEIWHGMKLTRKREWYQTQEKFEALITLLIDHRQVTSSWKLQEKWETRNIDDDLIKWLLKKEIKTLYWWCTKHHYEIDNFLENLILASEFVEHITDLNLWPISSARKPNTMMLDRCLSRYVNLEKLDLSGLHLNALGHSLISLNKLIEIGLNNNQLTEFPQQICQLTMLKKITA